MIRSTIEEALDIIEPRISWRDIAKAAGITDSALSHFKKGSELKFNTLLKVAKFVFKNNYFNTFKSWCLNLSHPMNIRYSMEFLAVNKQVNELDQLINKVEKSFPNRELTEWANAYKIQLMLLRYEPIPDILNKIRLFNTKSIEIKVLMLFFEASCMNRLREYNTMAAIINGMESTVEEVREDYIKESFKTRLKELLAYVNLFTFNKKEIARKFASEIISSDFCATLTAHAFYLVGMSYLFDNYDKCLGYIKKYRDSLILLGRERDALISENSDIPFINNVWKKYNERPVTSDITEIAHFEAVSGSKEQAIKLLDELTEKNGINGFSLYYKALATGDKTLFMQSMVYFVNKQGGKFYANLPYQYLKEDQTFAPIAALLLKD